MSANSRTDCSTALFRSGSRFISWETAASRCPWGTSLLWVARSSAVNKWPGSSWSHFCHPWILAYADAELAAGEHSWLLANTCSRARAYQQQSRPIDIITERTVAHRVEHLDAAHEPLRGRGLAAYALRRQVLVIDKYVFSDSFDEQGHAACSKWQGSELASKVRLSASIARGLAHRNSTSAVSLRRIRGGVGTASPDRDHSKNSNSFKCAARGADLSGD